MHCHNFVLIFKLSKVGDLSQEWPESFLFNNYYNDA